MVHVGWNRDDLSDADSRDPGDRLEEQLAFQDERYLFACMAVTVKPAIWPQFEIGELSTTERHRPEPRPGFVVPEG